MKQLILLHGAIGAKDQLRSLADILKTDFEVHTLNFSGHGGREFPSKPFSIDLFAQDVLDLLDEKKLSGSAIFGYSMGGYVAIYLAKHFPEKITGVITLATKFRWDKDVAANEAKMLDAETIEKKVPSFANELRVRHAPQDWRELLARTKELLVALGNNNELKPGDYASICLPCLLMLGDRDKMVTLEETVDVYKNIPAARLAVLPQTPHPIEKVNLTALGFFIKQFLS